VSDFDSVLERLLSDPGFKAALAADPARALAGYRLSADEVELLGAQVSTETGGNRQVEERTSKASLFGLLGSVAGAGLGHAATSGVGHAGSVGHAGIGTPMQPHGIGAPLNHPQGVPAGYHPHVDADGDGHWDQYTVRGRPDGGVDIYADTNHDGRPDFIGHDDNHDGIVDSADVDSDHDGVFETHLTDTNGDGWMDTQTVDPPPTWSTGAPRLGPAG